MIIFLIPGDSADEPGEMQQGMDGVGNWRLYHHDDSEAAGLFRNVVKGEAWNAWGFIRSELELIRGQK